MRISIQNKIQAGFGVALVVLLITGMMGWWSAHRNAQAFVAVEQSNLILNALESFLVEELNQHSHVRDFVLTGNETFLKLYQDDTEAVRKSMTEVQHLTSGHPELQERLAALQSLIEKKGRVCSGDDSPQAIWRPGGRNPAH